MNRRSFLMTSAVAVTLPSFGLADRRQVLRAEPVSVQILPDGSPPTDLWGFNGSMPGPEIRVKQGQPVDVNFENKLTQPSSVHWHGIRIDNAMDGVPGLTQDTVPVEGNFDYRFLAPDAGTYWYHSHDRSWEQVARGLFGPLIVEEASPPDVDHDLTVLIDDWRLTEDGEQAGGFDSMHDRAHAGRLGNFARALITSTAQVRQSDRVRLRLINAATDRVFSVDVTGVTGMIVALDGMPLTTPELLTRLVLAPAQRVDIIADVVSEENVEFFFPANGSPYLLGQIAVEGTNMSRSAAPIAPLPPNRVAEPDMANAARLDLVMQGGAMTSRMMMRDGIWAFNDISGMGEAPMWQFEHGQTARISLRNDTRFAHGIHLHGHHFHEVDPIGTIGPLRDTTLVAAGEQRDIVCVFDNPGNWLLHCHMLGHQTAGMKTWVQVA